MHARLLSSRFNIEIILTLVTLGSGCKLLAACTYIPPSSPVAVYSDFCDALNEAVIAANNPDKILVFGDFNLPFFDLAAPPPSGAFRQSSEYLNDMSSLLSLRQTNHVRNHRGVTLDLIFCSDHFLTVNKADDVLVHPDVHHPPLESTIPVHNTPSSTDCYLSRNTRKCNLNDVFDRLLCTDMSFICQAAPLDDRFDCLLGLLEDYTLQSSPLMRLGVSPFPRWFSNDLKQLTILKKTAHRRFKESLSLAHYLEFSRLRSICCTLSKECYKNYLSKVETSISSNPRAFWGLVGAHRRSPAMPSCLILNDNRASDAKGKCELFSTYFSSVFSQPSDHAPNFDFAGPDCLNRICVSAEEIRVKLNHLDVNKGPGLDNITPAVVRHCQELLAEPLQILFNESLSKGMFPSALKKGFIIPLHKGGDPGDVRNYRPITISSVIGKVFESVVLDRLKPYTTKLIHPSQHGFVTGKSTVTNLLLFQELVLSSFRKNRQVDAVYIDMAKAFDKVDHRILVSKLKGYGVLDPLLSWIQSYLSDRTLVVKIGSTISEEFMQSSGVPQGSLLGPCLFNIFINDLVDTVQTNTLLFADDLKLFMEVSTYDDCNKIQLSLDAVKQWCDINKMSINPNKCSAVTYHRIKSPLLSSYFISGTEISRAEIIKDLGVIFSCDLSFSNHIDRICNQANRMLGFVSRTTRGIENPAALSTLFCSLVRQLVEYASPVWSPYMVGVKERLETLQRRFVRLVGVRNGHNYMEVPIEEISSELNLLPLALRRDVADTMFLLKTIRGSTNCPELLAEIDFRIPSHTRSRELLSRRHHGTSFDYNSPLARFVRLGNRLASECDLFCDGLPAIKKRAASLLTD